MKTGTLGRIAAVAIVCSIGLTACCTTSCPVEPIESSVSEEITHTTKTNLYHFPFDKADVSDQDKVDLDQLAAYLLTNSEVKAHIEGYADIRGSTAYNLALGMKRAVAVSEYLQQKGVEPERIDVHSFGAEKLADLGTTREAHAHNRRALVYFEVENNNVA